MTELHRGQALVPFSGWGLGRGGGGGLRRFARALSHRAVQSVEDALGESIDARMARLSTHFNELGFDRFGWDPEAMRYAAAVAAVLHRRYFRTEVYGLDKLPSGRMLLVANHSGQLPIDGTLLAATLVLDAEPPRLPRNMVEKWSAQLPFVSVFFPRCGQVVGSPENARLLLEQDETLIVFPEGAPGIAKTFDQRYQLVNFGMGFMRLALETGTPIVPVGIVGGEEQYISVADLKPLARLLGMPAFPVVPQFLFGMPLPLPTKYRIYFGDPLGFEGDPDDDDAVIEEKVWVVKQTVQSLINHGLNQRPGVFF